jgi:bifunctional non-homologous end joining protein LigD
MLSVASEFALEGFVVKRAASKYQPGGRSRDWIKHVRRERTNVVVGGWIPSRTQPGGAATLLLGGYDRVGNLTYCGHLSCFGLSSRLRRALHHKLTELASARSPFSADLPDSVAATARWVCPSLVGQIEYREFNVRFRHPVLKGIVDTDPAAVQLPQRPGLALGG